MEQILEAAPLTTYQNKTKTVDGALLPHYLLGPWARLDHGFFPRPRASLFSLTGHSLLVQIFCSPAMSVTLCMQLCQTSTLYQLWSRNKMPLLWTRTVTRMSLPPYINGDLLCSLRPKLLGHC